MAAKLMIGKRANENMLIICLDTKSSIIGATIAAAGSVDCIVIKLREIFKYAIICNATSIVVAHNHPSGFLAPSDDDINITRQIIAAGELLGIDPTIIRLIWAALSLAGGTGIILYIIAAVIIPEDDDIIDAE